MANYKPINEKKLIRSSRRREFLKSLGRWVAAGALIGVGANTSASYGKGAILSVIRASEKQVRELELDISALSGALEKKLDLEVKKFEEAYASGKLRIYEDLGIATPAELEEFEKIIRVHEEFEENYNFSERTRIFKDRIDRRILSTDEKLESYQPKPLRSLNDVLRKVLGQKSGEEGVKHRKAIKERLEGLCRIYDANEDNKTAEVEVFKKLNEYASLPAIPKEEKELFDFLLEYGRGNPQQLREYIKNYDTYNGVRDEELLKLRKAITESEKIYENIRENKAYISKLQEKLKEGIALKDEIRKKSIEEFSAYKSEFDKKAEALRDYLDSLIGELKNKGYSIETRKDFIDKTPVSEALDSIISPIITAGSVALGALTTGLGMFFTRKSRNARALAKASNTAVINYNNLLGGYNQLRKEHDALTDENRRLKDRINTPLTQLDSRTENYLNQGYVGDAGEQ